MSEEKDQKQMYISEAVGILVTASVLGHLLSLGKEIIVAAMFGITKGMDAFYAATTIPMALNNILVSTAGAVLIPILVGYSLRDRDETNRVTSLVINYFILGSAFISIVLYVCAPVIIRYGFSGFDVETTVRAVFLLRFTSLAITAMMVTGIMTAFLQTYKDFTAPAYSQIVVTGSIIGAVLVSASRYGVNALVFGMVAGTLLQAMILLYIAVRKGFRFSFTVMYENPVIRHSFLLALPLFIAVIASHINQVVDRIMASYLTAGSIAAMGYADKLVRVPMVVLSASISTAVFPFFSVQAAQDKLDEMRASLNNALSMTAFIFFPITAVLVYCSRSIVQILFQRATFDAAATSLTAAIFAGYSLQLFFYTGFLILVRVFLSFKDAVSVLKVSLIGLVLNIALNSVFIACIQPPAAGIALSTSCVFAFMMIYLIVLLYKKSTVFSGPVLVSGIAKITCCTGCLMFVMLLFPRTSVHPWWACAAALSGIVSYGVAAKACNLEEFEKLMNVIRRTLVNIKERSIQWF